MENELMLISEAAAWAGVSKRTLWWAISHGYLRTVSEPTPWGPVLKTSREAIDEWRKSPHYRGPRVKKP